MDKQQAELFPRFIAALIDGVIGWVFAVVPIIGPIITSIYILLKDALPYQISGEAKWKNKSVGKYIMSLEVACEKADLVDTNISAKRNIPLTIGSFIAIIPVLGWVIGPIVGMVFLIIELVLIFTDDKRQRLGDRWADTIVIASREVEEIEEDIEKDKNKEDEEDKVKDKTEDSGKDINRDKEF